jgi:class 3 adenylate cyclase
VFQDFQSETAERLEKGPVHTAPRVRRNPKGESTILRLLAPDSAVDMPAGPLPGAPRSNAWVTETSQERALLVFVFTDIVGSTETAERLGDQAWCALLLQHHIIVRAHLRSCGGREVDAAGDGFFAVFERPSCALRFLTLARAALIEIGVQIRAGVHAGECAIVGTRVEGVAVHVAARVASAGRSGEILVSQTVKDLLAGSELRFQAMGLHALKGLTEPRLLFALEAAEERRCATSVAA